MKQKGKILLVVLAVLTITMSCGLPFGLGANDGSDKPQQAEKKGMEENKEDNSPSTQDSDTEQYEGSVVETDFPLPPKAKDVTAVGDEMVNFQVKMSLEEVMDFYRTILGGQGLTERDILTVTSDTTFSMAFDGSANGKAIIIQGVDLGNSQTNVNIRYEDV